MTEFAGLKVSPYIRIQLQDGPVREHGVNGAQIDDVIEWCVEALKSFNQPPYQHLLNEAAIAHLNRALDCLRQRTIERTMRGVEGTSKP